VRAYVVKHGTVPMEPALRAFESDVVEEARDWGLDWHHSGGRLAALELLAALQHYGVPTRLLDFTFNPLVACWFAVESRDVVPGRVFAIDISDRVISRDRAAEAEPWWLRIPPGTATEWATQSWVWSPPPLEPRIVRQDGCFLMGGVPSTNPARSRRTAAGTWEMLHADEVRECMSVPFKLINYDQAVAALNNERLVGAPPKARAFTLKINGDKGELRAELARAFGHSHRSLFPDFPGLSQFGQSFR
jgi:FRG domain-containing protein